eukprot:m.581813 g.581813  ORF g.581813 m.581813 type:complete len:728 (+) comp57940_c1_seq2:581-2764(+)
MPRETPEAVLLALLSLPEWPSTTFTQSLLTGIEASHVSAIMGSTLESIFMRGVESPDLTAIAPSLLPIRRLLHLGEFGSVLVAHPRWMPKGDPRLVGKQCLLGPFFCASVYPRDQPAVAAKLFPRASLTEAFPEVERAIESTRDSLRLIRDGLAEIIEAAVKNKASRDAVLDFFQAVNAMNTGRCQMRDIWSAELTCSPDGMLDSVLHVLLRLAQPLIVKTTGKFEALDAAYVLRPGCRIITKNQTCIAKAESIPDELTKSTTAPNFSTHLIFLTLECLHVGHIATLHRYNEIVRGPQGALQEIESLRSQLPGVPAVLRAHYEEEITQKTRAIFCQIAQLQDPRLVDSILSFYGFVCDWILSLIDPSSLGTDLSATVPVAYGMWPEYILTDLAEFLSSIALYPIKVLETSTFLPVILRTMLVLLNNRPYAKTVHVQSNFVAFFARFTTPVKGQVPTSRVSSYLLTDSFSVRCLTPMLVRYYVGLEEGDPYSKYNKRYNVSLILKFLWSSSDHRQALLSLIDRDNQFVRFVMLLINDTTYLLDESRGYLNKIHEAQTVIASATATATEKQDAARNLAQARRVCKPYISLANETIDTFVLLSKHIVDPFLRDEIASRLTAMMNYNLRSLLKASPLKLSIDECRKYGFDAQTLLRNFVMMYLQLSCLVSATRMPLKIKFLEAVVRDGRSFELDVFQRAVFVLRNANALNADLLSKLDELIAPTCQGAGRR